MGFNGTKGFKPNSPVVQQRMVLAVGVNGVYLIQNGEVFEDFKLSFNLSYDEIDGYPFYLKFRHTDSNNQEQLLWNTHDLRVQYVHRENGSNTLVGDSYILQSRFSNQDFIELIVENGEKVLRINGVDGTVQPVILPEGTIRIEAQHPITIENLHIEIL